MELNYDYEIENKYFEKLLFYGCRLNLSRKPGTQDIIVASAIETEINGDETHYSATGSSVGEASKNLHIAVLLGRKDKKQ